MNRTFVKAAVFVLIIVALFFGASLIYLNVYGLDDNITIADTELDALQPKYPLTVTTEKTDEGVKLKYKAFSVPIKSVQCTVAESKKVFLGGMPLGISVRDKGLAITAKNEVLTRSGMVSPTGETDVRTGDVLLAIDGKEVNTQKEVLDALSASEGDIKLTLQRDGAQFEVSVTPAVDLISKQRRLGLVLKNEIAGIGTMTYINAENGRYGALGHPIKDGETGRDMSTPNGNIYNSVIFGVIKGQKGKAGELTGSFNKNSEPLGTVDANNEFGIFGSYSGSTEGMQTVALGSKYSVKPGKAYIYTTINGNPPQKYEIEIVKNIYQNQAKSKGMVIRVTDKALLEATGGIVQGMSGSPIIQNDRLVGAVTHVFINDPTRGYGVYIDWMINN